MQLFFIYNESKRNKSQYKTVHFLNKAIICKIEICYCNHIRTHVIYYIKINYGNEGR